MTAGAGEELRELPGARRLDALYAADTWSADELGVRAAAGHQTLSFDDISQPWLRQGAKRWALHRLALNHAFNTVVGGVLSFKRFSAFLTSCQPPVSTPSAGRPRRTSSATSPGCASSPWPSPPSLIRGCSSVSSWRRTGASVGWRASTPTPCCTTTR